MLFQEEHIEQIREGEKTATRRDWTDGYNRPSEGSIRMATTEMFTPDEKCDCYIRVTDVRRETLAEMNDADADAEGGYTLEEFREVWRDINGEWDPTLTVDVVEFEYVGRDRPSENQKPVTDGGTGTTPVAECAIEGCDELVEFPDGEGEHCILHIITGTARIEEDES